jgi:hypothetical protein
VPAKDNSALRFNRLGVIDIKDLGKLGALAFDHAIAELSHRRGEMVHSIRICWICDRMAPVLVFHE